ncbi:hypothetical protein [Rhizobium sp. 007]|uniref:hypothetical protein n=1 Tax=Rhizobium sp. 007 TaxID=2785056 RepID=UPI00188F7E73|nr:hypothetical protein [Rhizobium sp. 007]QPB24566.1 hypothetical protein ISN39_34060 [Rhizobium sp. 007]
MIEPEQETSMVDFDAPGATAPVNIDNLPNETLTEVFRQVANQNDRVAAFYEINALRSTAQRFRAVIESDQTIRSEFRTLQQETRSARSLNALIDSSAGTRTANDIITYHGVTAPVTQYTIKGQAAQRDINAGMDARTAIGRNDVDDPRMQYTIKWQAAGRDINAGMVARTVIERNDVDDPRMQDTIKWQAAGRDINAGMDARIAIERNDVVDQRTQNDIRQQAAELSQQVTPNATRGLDERSRQEGGRGR